jgi:NADP-dependent 3-hydroxy acid dehydrogenase YdfG
MSTPLTDRIALVTGASSGFGQATALALARAGAHVAIAARRRDRLDALKALIEGEGGQALVIEVDLSKEAEARRAVAETEAHYGRLDILVNNAGVMYLGPVETADLAKWRHMFDLNVMGLMAATQAALPGMRARRDGHIVNVSSTAGRMSNAGAGGYSGSKFAVNAFSEALRKETYKDNIRVTVVEPGVAATELRDHVPDAAAKTAINAYADGMRQLQAEDVANAILFAVSQPDHVNINEILMRPTDQER